MKTYCRVLMPLACCLLLSGCYYLHLAAGETHLLLQREPIRRVLDQPDTDPQLKARLRKVLAAREFASAHLDLPRNASYTLYADIGRPYVMYNVWATPPLSLAPVTHCFPIAGCVAYKGFYQRERADAAADKLRKQGKDVYVSGVVAYSTLGHFADPVLSSMLRWDNDQLIGTIFHELAHQKLYVKGATAFNESFATFVQRQGLRAWHAATHTRPQNPAARQRRRQFTALVLSIRKQLKEVYQSDQSDARKRQRKKAIIKQLRRRYRHLHDTRWQGKDPWQHWVNTPINNAKLLPFGVYDRGVPAFASLFRGCDDNWPCFYAAAQNVARQSAERRKAFLHGSHNTPAGGNADTGQHGAGW